MKTACHLQTYGNSIVTWLQNLPCHYFKSICLDIQAGVGKKSWFKLAWSLGISLAYPALLLINCVNCAKSLDFLSFNVRNSSWGHFVYFQGWLWGLNDMKTMKQWDKQKLCNPCQFSIHRVSLSSSSSWGKRQSIKAFLFFTKVHDRFWLSHECCFFILSLPQTQKSKVFLYCAVVLKCDICLQRRSLSIKTDINFQVVGLWPSHFLDCISLGAGMKYSSPDPAVERSKLFTFASTFILSCY